MVKFKQFQPDAIIKAAIIGVSGYTGKEAFSLLLKHPQVRISYVGANKTQGAMATLFPEFLNKTTANCELFDVKHLPECDVVFLALPHTESMSVASHFLKKGIRVIDLSADYRLKSAAIYEKWYGHKHTDSGNLSKAIYGLPELHRVKIKKATLLANPGCYPTAAALGLAPIIAVRSQAIVHVMIDAKSGVSGAGRKASIPLLFTETNENFKAYKVLSHQHTPEIEQTLTGVAQRKMSVDFVAHLLPLNRGILNTMYVRLSQSITLNKLHAIYEKFYKTEPFVRVLPLTMQPELKHVVGTNMCDIGLAVSADGKTVVVTSAIDNLVKGAAGQAVQNMNLMFGFNETCGLI